MTALVTKHLPLVAVAPDGIKKLRALILELAVRGKLVAQDTSDATADSLLADIRVRLQEKSSSVRARKSLISAPIDVDELPFVLPTSWRWARFSEITSYVQRGKGPIYADRSQYPVISQKCVRWTGLDLSQARHIDPSSIERYEEVRHLVEGDILWNSTGTGTIGRACVVKSTMPGQVLVADSHVTVVRCESVVPEYLWRWIQTPTVQDQIEKSASGSTNQIELNTSTVLAHLAPIPPLAEQHRIVAKVDELMALCDRLEADQADAEAAHAQLVQALLASLTQATDAADFRASWQRLSEHFHTLFTTEASIDALKQTVLQLAVMGKLVPQDFADESPSILLERIANEVAIETLSTGSKKSRTCAEVEPAERYVDTPSSWIWTRLGSQVLGSGAGWSPSCEARPRVNDEWGVLKVSAVSWGEFRPEENKALPVNLEARPEHEVQAGDFLVSRANTAELVARSVVVESPPPRLMLSDKIVRFRLTTHCNRRYVNLVNSSPFARSYYGVMAGGTSSSMKNVTREQILNLPLPLPPLVEQHRIVAKVDELMALCDQLKAQLSAARQQHAQLASVLVEQAVA